MAATWQRCRVHFMRNAPAHAGKSGRRVVSAFIATAFAQEDAATGQAQWRKVADQLRPKLPKLATFMDQAETDVLAYIGLPKDHWSKIPLHQDEWAVQRCRYMTLESVFAFGDDPLVSLPIIAA
jgi:putative transposase